MKVRIKIQNSNFLYVLWQFYKKKMFFS